MEQPALIKKKLDEIVEGLRSGEPGPPREALEDFARRLLGRGSADLLERASVPEIVAHVRALFELVDATGPDEIAVQVRRLTDGPDRAVVETVMPDGPFIVDSVRETLHARGFGIPQLLHPVLVFQRDEGGRIVQVLDRSVEGPRTSVVNLTIEGSFENGTCTELEGEIRYVLGEVRAVSSDFSQMLERSAAIIGELDSKKREVPWRAGELEEIEELLRWMQEVGFVYLGYRAYDIEPDESGREWIRLSPGSGLGILRDEKRSRYSEPRPVDELAPELKARVLGGPLLIVSKTNAESPIRRRARMDYIGIKKLGPEGTVRGEHRFLGLFTAKAYNQDASTIPILRRKLTEVLQREGAAKGSHDYGVILQTFNSMPKEELFVASVAELRSVIDTVTETEGADDVRVTARLDALGRGVNVMVILPRQRFSGQVRRKMQDELVRVYEGRLLNYHLALGRGEQARLHFYISPGLEEVDRVDVRELESLVRESVRSWEERLEDALEEVHGTERARELAARHGTGFSAEYRAIVGPRAAVSDIDVLERLDRTGVQQTVLEEIDPETPQESRLKIFAPHGMFVLSDVMPTLENLGFRVIEADRFDIGAPEGAPAATIHLFEVQAPVGWQVDRAAVQPRVADLLRGVQEGVCEDDALNSLVLSTGLDWRQVSVLRAYSSYAFQIGGVASRQGGRRPLIEYPTMALGLVRIFESLHDPAVGEDRVASTRGLERGFLEELDSVRGIEDDRTFRRFLALVQATVRTNFYGARFRTGAAPVALKLACREIDFLPVPKPRFEIYMNGPGTEASHLRMDRVARGGIRWSDRPDDFRVEVLGLVKTQQVKNTVIVPAGAKGAFIVKNPPADRGQAAGLACYRQFIETLLDLTDNLVDGEVRPPEGLVVRDEPDPYLVVAADKGTTKNSDTANELAVGRAFWLGDAFASGGSQGYDHKALGITARGVWESVKRHFLELGLDIQREQFTVVGIGDMSGDVFGNGMLLSRCIRLVAAFDHRHIMIDPDPDPETSWEERKRLFEMPGSSWSDYDATRLSEGGGVFERTVKRVELSPQARERLSIDATVLNGDELIQAILTAPVDLLWNGGIGTYVRAEAETHAAVADPSSDRVRIDAGQLRARVVGEGGNLGLTQRARIEYALAGGRLNTDALDNSAGVDMSDHEVNLKILLNGAVASGEMTHDARNGLLREITEDVAASVLSNNYYQSLAVSLDELRAAELPEDSRETLLRFEGEKLLDRRLESLPTQEELVERLEAGKTLTRPELAVILAYAKMHLKRWILSSELPDDLELTELLESYFPDRALASVEPDLVAGHQLRRHIVTAVLTNRLVDRMGATFHIKLMAETGASASAVTRMWYLAGRISDVEGLYREIRECDDRITAGVQYQWYLEISNALARATRWLLANPLAADGLGGAVERLHEPVREIRRQLPELLSGVRSLTFENHRSLHEMDGLPAETALRLASFQYLDELLPVARLVRRTGLEVRRVGEIYFGIGDEVDFPWLRRSLDRLPADQPWTHRAAKLLTLRLEETRRRIAEEVLRDVVDEETSVEEALRRFRERHYRSLRYVRDVMADVRTSDRPELAALVVAVHAIEERLVSADGV